MADTASPISVVIEDDDDTTRVDPETGALEIQQEDGSVVVNLSDHRRKDDDEDDENKFYANLAEDIQATKLGQIANELFDAIEADHRSRAGYLAVLSRGLDLLGTKLEEPKSTVGDSSSAIDGMSSVTNPLLLEAVLKGWANAQAELLPAAGPVKVKDDGEETSAEDDLADALERDMNHYFTVTASEYYPDTSHMLLWGVYFGGSGFKKVYRCPMKRRPVSESVGAKDLIVSDTTKDLKSCGRVTHQIPMRPSVMKRMKFLGAYRDVQLTQPSPVPNQVDTKIAGIQGTSPQRAERPEDQPYTIWETQCELDLDEYAPPKFKGEGIALPYIVTMDKDSREILAIRRDWREDDEECERQRMYVKYPYVPGPGFYGTGMLNILGNSSAAMTAAWREALDAGMFASFPGGLIAKLGGRQNTSNFRVGPGEFAPVETSGMKIQDVAMGMPYHDVTPGLMTLMDKITAQCEKLSGAAEIPAAEGIQNVPVGTMLAQIEQATKVMAAAHKGMHTAQSEEIELIVDLFRTHPSDFWRLNKICKRDFWNEEKFIAALNNCNLVPVSDPNVPSHIHRVMKALALLQLKTLFPGKMSDDEILKRCLAAIREDPNGLLLPDPPPAPPDPKMIESQAKLIKAQSDAGLAQAKAQNIPQETIIAAEKLKTERISDAMELEKARVIHQTDAVRTAHDMDVERVDQQLKTVKTADELRQRDHDRGLGVAQHGLAQKQHDHDKTMDHAKHSLDVHVALNPPKPDKPKK